MPIAAPMRPAVLAWSPVSIAMCATPARRSRPTASRPVWRTASATAMTPAVLPSAATSTTVRPSPAMPSAAAVDGRRRPAPLLEQPPAADHRRHAVDLGGRPRGRAAPGRRRRHASRRPRRAPRDGWRGRWDARTGSRWTAASRSTSARVQGATVWTSTTAGMPCVSVPVLSNATHRTRPSVSRCRPPLMSTPFLAARGERRHDGDRRRDHERARARDHQEHEGAIHPRPRLVRTRAAERRATSGREPTTAGV